MTDESERPTVQHVGDACLWVEHGASVHIKAVTSFNDPVELAAHEARQLANLLLRLADDADQ